MAILQKHLEEALMGKEETNVLRAIARMSVLIEAISSTDKIHTELQNSEKGLKTYPDSILVMNHVTNYLYTQVHKTLMQIKVPRTSTIPSKPAPKVQGSAPVTTPPTYVIRDPNNP